MKIKGKIIFDPKDVTNKHSKQSSWKKIAMVQFNCDICEYYSWFFKKKYGVILNSPLRGPHISFINDSIRDLNGGFYGKKSDNKLKDNMWSKLKSKYHKADIEINLSNHIQTNGEHVWLRVEHEDRKPLQDIRDEVGLPIPNLGKNKDGTLKPLGVHMTIGFAINGRVDDNIEEGFKKIGRNDLDDLQYVYDLDRFGLDIANKNKTQYLINSGVLKYKNGIFI